MQLLLRRSQRGGLTGSMIFCLDARTEFTPPEKESIRRYRLGGLVIYNSEASKRALDKSDAADGRSIVGNLQRLAYLGLASLRLNISVNSLERGQHVECKSLDELLGAEEAIMDACRNLRLYLDTAETFDGREVVLDFTTEEPKVVALSAGPAPMLAAATAQAAPPPPMALRAPTPSAVDSNPYDDRFGYAEVSSTSAPTHEMADGEAVPINRVRSAYDPARPNKRPASEPIMQPEARTFLLILGAVTVFVLCAQFFMSRW